MKRLCSAILLVGTICILSGCSGPSAADDTTFQKLFQSLIQLFDRLDEFKVASSVESAKAELDELADTIRTLRQKVKAIPDDERKVLYERHDQLVKTAKEKHFKQMRRAITGELPAFVLMRYLTSVKQAPR